MSEQILLLPYFYKGVIYLIENIQNRKKYIGKTQNKNPEKYIEDHFVEALNKSDLKRNKNGKQFYKAIRKYGRKNFKIIILGVVYGNTKKELNENLNKAEIACIYHFRTFGADGIHKDDIYGYNMTIGGDGGSIVQMFGKNNPMYFLKGKLNPGYIERKQVSCLCCNTSFEKRPNENKKFCTKKCSIQYIKESIWMYNDNLNRFKKVHKTLVNNFLNNGWIKGRGENFKNHLSKTRKGKNNPNYGNHKSPSIETINKIKESKRKNPYKPSEESKEKNRQSHLGKFAWNRGLTKETDKRVKKYSDKRVKVDQNEIIKLKNLGMKQKDIAILLNCSASYICFILKKYKS